MCDVLTTPLGSRICRRNYGSELFRLIDQPLNSKTLLKIYAATSSAIKTWVPEFDVKNVSVTSPSAGAIVLLITGVYKPTGEQITLDGIRVK